MNSNICFIIVTFNPKVNKFNFLLSVLKNYETIVINNGQTLHDIKGVKYIDMPENSGYVGANTGIRQELRKDFDWTVVLNQDIGITRTFPLQLANALEKLQPCVAGPVLGSLDTKRWTTSLPENNTNIYISGSCIAIHKQVIKKVGYFFESYFMYYEDVDYCIRAKKNGFPIIQIRVSGYNHQDNFHSTSRKYYLARNHLLFVERMAPINVKIHELARLPRTLWEHNNKGEFGATAGIMDYLKRHFGRKDDL